MPSSTSPHGFSERRLRIITIGALLAAPLVVLNLLQTNYVLAYQACADRSNSWLHVPSATAVVLSVALVALAWTGWVGATRARRPLEFLGASSLMLALLMLIVVVAMAIPPMILHPCD